MANLLSWAGNAANTIGRDIGQFFHPQPQTPAPIPDVTRMAAANIGRAAGYGNSNSTQPYSPPLPLNSNPGGIGRPGLLPVFQTANPTLSQLPPFLPPRPAVAPPLQFKNSVTPADIALAAAKGIGHQLVDPIIGSYNQMMTANAQIDASGHPILQNTIDKTGNFIKAIGQTGTGVAQYLAPELKVLKGGAEAAPLVKAGIGLINHGASSAPISVANSLANGNTNPIDIAKNAAIATLAAGTVPGLKQAGKEAPAILKGEGGFIGGSNSGQSPLNSDLITPKSKASLARLDATEKQTEKLLTKDGVKIDPKTQLPNSISVKPGTTFYHGTTLENANSLVKNGFDPRKNTKGFAESPYALSASTIKKANSDHAASTYGNSIVNVKAKEPVTLLDANSPKWLTTMGSSKNVTDSAKWAKQLKAQGYDGIKEANGEVTIFNHDKFNFSNGGGKTPPPKLNSNSMPDPNLPKERGLVTSVHDAPNVSPETQVKTQGSYLPKPNTQLMGEAKALLSDHANLDIKNVKNVDQKVAATMQHALNLDAAGQHNEAAALFNNLAEHGTELGRGVQAFSMLPKMSPQAIAISVAGRINKYNETAIKKIPQLTGDQQKLISDKINTIDQLKPGSREHGIATHELHNMINEFIPSSFVDKAITVWKAGLLTSLRTHERNFVGNATMGAAEIAKDPFATLADKAMSLATGKRTQTSTLRGLGAAASKDTRQQVKDLVTKGFDPSSPVSKYDVAHVTWGTSPVQQALKHYTDAVFRTLGAEDRSAYNGAFARSLHDQAGAEAINAGKKGDKAFIDNLVKNPTEDMQKTATTDASYATFHDKTQLANFAGDLKRRARQMGGVKGEVAKALTEITMPFTGVPSSIVGKTIAYSPIGLVKGAVNTGRVMAGQVPELQRQAAQEIGRGVVGTGLFGLGAYLMSQGLMTGQPKNAQEAAQWQLEHKQANSVLIGGRWRSINSIGPQQLVMLAGAKAQESLNDPKSGGVGGYAAALGKDQLSQTFLAGVQGPLQALNDPVRYGGSYVQNTAGSVVPNGVKDLARATDPATREINSVPDAIQNGLPGLRNQLLPKRDVLGEVIPQEPGGASAFFDLFNSKTPVHNSVVDELSRLSAAGTEATPSKLDKTQTILGNKVKLDPKQLDQLEQLSGQPITQQFAQLISTPEYQAAPDEMKQKALNGIVDQVRAQARVDLGSGVTASGSGTASPNNLAATTKQAQLTLAKDAFDKSGKNYQVIGDTVLRRDAQGNITATPKVKFDYDLGTARLTQQKNAGDVSGWLATAQSQLDSISKQLQDPSVDPLDAIKLQNDATALQKDVNKYTAQGGFTKGKTAKKTTSSNLASIKSINSLIKTSKLSSKAPTAAKVPKLSTAKLPKLKTTAFTPKTAKVTPKPAKVRVAKLPNFKGYV